MCFDFKEVFCYEVFNFFIVVYYQFEYGCLYVFYGKYVLIISIVIENGVSMGYIDVVQLVGMCLCQCRNVQWYKFIVGMKMVDCLFNCLWVQVVY